MKTAEPKIIYLQIGEDADITEFEEGDFWTNAITWCWERIFKNDIEYISKQSIIGIIDEMINKLEQSRIGGRLTQVALAGVNLTIIRLNDLKQKIMEAYPSDGGTST